MPKQSMAKTATPASTVTLPTRRRLAMILGLLAVVLYANTFFNGYVLDDSTAVRDNAIVSQGVSGIPEIFSTPYLHGSVRNANDLYRPLTLATFAIEQTLFGGNPMPAHIVNVLLFAACVMLLFLFLDSLLAPGGRVLAFFATLLFALHPIHTEVVANIKSRDELLCFCFGIAALYNWLRYARSGKTASLLTAGGFFLLSLLSKETSLCFVGLVPLLFFLWERPPGRRSLTISLTVAGLTVLVLLVRFSVLNVYDANHPFTIALTENALAGVGVSGRLATAILILGMYLRLLLIPYPLSSDYSYNTIPVTGFSDWRVLLVLAIYIAILAAGTRRLLQGRKDVFALSALFFLVPLALFSNIFFLVGATMAERFLFFPSVGFCLLGGLLLNRLGKEGRNLLTDRRPYLFLAPIVVVWGALTILRNTDWKDDYTLCSRDMKHAPDSYRLPYYLASATLNASNAEGDTARRRILQEEALGYMLKSIAIYPDFSTTQAQAGITLMTLGHIDSAETHILMALSLNPADTFSRNNLAAVYFRQGRYHESIAECRANLALYPSYTREYTNIGACYLRLGVADSAITVLQNALALSPGDRTAGYFLSVAKSMAGHAAPAAR